jgi:ubiquinone/menaquinone biosynthesis C-methylase UbiE
MKSEADYWRKMGQAWAAEGVQQVDRKRVHQLIKEHLDQDENAKILDLASGDKSYLDKSPSEVIHADISQKLLALNPSESQKVAMNALNLSFIDNSFDSTINTFMMRYLSDEDQKEALIEMIRVTKKGGKIIVVDFYRVNYEDKEVEHRFDAYLLDEAIQKYQKEHGSINNKVIETKVVLIKDEKEGTGKGTGTPSNMFGLIITVN